MRRSSAKRTLEASDHCLLCLGFNAFRIYCPQEMKISLQKVVKSEAGADVIKGQSTPSSFERIEVKPTLFAVSSFVLCGDENTILVCSEYAIFVFFLYDGNVRNKNQPNLLLSD